jgi:hypothetical protein
LANAALTWALKFSQSRLAARLVIVVISDQLNFHHGRGWICWPGNPYIEKDANLSPRAVTESIENLIELGEISVDRKPGELTVFRMPKFEAWYEQKKTVENNPENASATPANGAPHPRKRRTPANGAPPQTAHPPPQTALKSDVVSLTNPEVPLSKSNTPPTPPLAGGTLTSAAPATPTPQHKPQVQFRNEKIVECADGICRVEMGNRHRLFTKRELEATAGTFWTCESMSKFLRARNFQVQIEYAPAVSAEVVAMQSAERNPPRVRAGVLERAAAR